MLGGIYSGIWVQLTRTKDPECVAVCDQTAQHRGARPSWLKFLPSETVKKVIKNGRLMMESGHQPDSGNEPSNGKGAGRRQSRVKVEEVEDLMVMGIPLLGHRDQPIGALFIELPSLTVPENEKVVDTLGVVAEMVARAVTAQWMSGHRNRLQLDDNAGLREELSRHYDFSLIIGNSGAMRQVYEQIAQIASARTTVLITGESGTGKELVAQALHINSPRAERPFIKVNCSSLPESLIESELFGHERGAFTHAETRRLGRFELAEGGTLMLDEIGELSLAAQVKLLRVLQTREFEPVGSIETKKADVRILAATNRDLEQEIAGGRFRADLYYRLNLFPIIVPPLRERPDDLLPLAEHFLEKFARSHRKGIRRLSPQAIELLMSYHWPGNVRELQNTIERAVLVSDGRIVEHYHLPPAIQIVRSVDLLAKRDLFTAVEDYEKELICTALRTTRGRRSQAAELLGISERVLSYKIKKHRIDHSNFR